MLPKRYYVLASESPKSLSENGSETLFSLLLRGQTKVCPTRRLFRQPLKINNLLFDLVLLLHYNPLVSIEH